MHFLGDSQIWMGIPNCKNPGGGIVEYVNRCDGFEGGIFSKINELRLFLRFGENIYNWYAGWLCGTAVDS